MGGQGTILLVEDSSDVRELICDDVLEYVGYTTHSVKDAPAALAFLEQSGPVDLLLTDIVLPRGMNGVELARRVQETAPLTEVLFMTGYSVDELENLGISVSDHYLFHKPFSVEDLMRVVAETLDGRNGSLIGDGGGGKPVS